MTQRSTAIIGAPTWVDVTSADPARTRDFYCRLFGWDAEEPNPELGGYSNFTKDGVRIAGSFDQQEPGTPDVWSLYFAVEDASKTLETAVAHGAQVIVEAMEIPGGLGTMGVFVDPTGAVAGVWQPGSHQGFGFVAEPNAPGWFELHTREHKKAVAFYTAVLGVEGKVVGDTDEFRYTILGQGDEEYAGIIDVTNFPPGSPTGWSIYFGVVDTDATLAKIVELGGAVVVSAENTPYGRLAAATDPTGALFKLVGDNS